MVWAGAGSVSLRGSEEKLNRQSKMRRRMEVLGAGEIFCRFRRGGNNCEGSDRQGDERRGGWCVRDRCKRDDAGDAAVLCGERGASGLPDVLPNRGLLRAVLRRCDRRIAGATAYADRAGSREEARSEE